MPIIVDCQCGKKLKVKDELAGKKIKCPSCGEVMTVEPPLDEIELSETLEHGTASARASEMKTRKCPSCNRTILADLDDCTYCNKSVHKKDMAVSSLSSTPKSGGVGSCFGTIFIALVIGGGWFLSNMEKKPNNKSSNMPSYSSSAPASTTRSSSATPTSLYDSSSTASLSSAEATNIVTMVLNDWKSEVYKTRKEYDKMHNGYRIDAWEIVGYAAEKLLGYKILGTEQGKERGAQDVYVNMSRRTRGGRFNSGVYRISLSYNQEKKEINFLCVSDGDDGRGVELQAGLTKNDIKSVIDMVLGDWRSGKDMHRYSRSFKNKNLKILVADTNNHVGPKRWLISEVKPGNVKETAVVTCKFPSQGGGSDIEKTYTFIVFIPVEEPNTIQVVSYQ